MSKIAEVPSFLTKRPAKHNNNKNETVLHDHAASRLVKSKDIWPKMAFESVIAYFFFFFYKFHRAFSEFWPDILSYYTFKGHDTKIES